MQKPAKTPNPKHQLDSPLTNPFLTEADRNKGQFKLNVKGRSPPLKEQKFTRTVSFKEFLTSSLESVFKLEKSNKGRYPPQRH
jgi:hypothetical protein